MHSDRPFQTFGHGHQDIVLAASYNYYGDRLVTASSDHRVKVWDRKGESWMLVDTWRGHDAEITDVKWNGPFVGQVFASIGEDGYFKLWEEDLSQPQNSGRRFRSIMNPLPSKSKLSWMSIDFKNINTETYLALITREGNLTVMEPKDHNNLAGDWIDWMANQDFFVCQSPPRAEETSFRLCFHHEKLPCWAAISAGLDRKALSLAVSAMDMVKIYRSDGERHLYLAAQLSGFRSLVRDVSWANGSMRGYDVIATACKDGSVRIYELWTAHSDVDRTALLEGERTSAAKQFTESTALNQQRNPRTLPSGIGAGLAGVARANVLLPDDSGSPELVKSTPKLVAELMEHRGAVWRVNFSYMGDVLTSTGDDGTVRAWKKSVNGSWLEYAEIDLKELS